MHLKWTVVCDTLAVCVLMKSRVLSKDAFMSVGVILPLEMCEWERCVIRWSREMRTVRTVPKGEKTCPASTQGTLSQSGHNRLQAPSVPQKLLAAMFSQAKITERGREGGARELRSMINDTIPSKTWRREREQDVGQMQEDSGEWAWKRCVKDTFWGHPTVYPPTTMRLVNGCFSVVSGCCNDDRFPE